MFFKFILRVSLSIVLFYPFFTLTNAANIKTERLEGYLSGVSCTGKGDKAVCVAVGNEWLESPDLYTIPLIVQTQNGGKTWAGVHCIAKLPKKGELLASSCTGNGGKTICIAVGNARDPNGSTTDTYPLILHTKNGGKKWQVDRIPNLPAGFGELKSASCVGDANQSFCIAAGALNNQPFLIESSDGGLTWKIVEVRIAKATGALSSTSCTGQGNTAICIAVGTGARHPIVMQTKDSGNTWERLSFIQKENMYRFTAASCSGEGTHAICAAVGTDGNDSIIAQTVDGGFSWGLKTVINPPPHVIFFDTTYCLVKGDKNICIAGGEGDGPKLVQSIDKGKTWMWKSVTGVPETSPRYNPYYAMTCVDAKTDIMCIAVGEFRFNDQTEPLLVQTMDRGENWAARFIKSAPPFGILLSVSCTPNGYTPLCVAVGVAGNRMPPLLVQSENGGVSWFVPEIHWQ